MPIAAAEVRRIAALARIELAADEVEAFRRELEAILNYMRMLDELAVEAGVAPELSVSLRDLRDDRPTACLTAEEALGNAPEQGSGLFRVPRVLAATPDETDDS